MNGDELLDLDYGASSRSTSSTAQRRRSSSRKSTPRSASSSWTTSDRVHGFREAPKLEHWVNAGVYVLGEEALERLPEKGDHEVSTFPELAREGTLRAFRYTGVWLTVNTPKDLRRAEEYLVALPERQ